MVEGKEFHEGLHTDTQRLIVECTENVQALDGSADVYFMVTMSLMFALWYMVSKIYKRTE